MKKKFSINTLIPILSFLILFCVFLIATRGTLVTLHLQPNNGPDIAFVNLA